MINVSRDGLTTVSKPTGAVAGFSGIAGSLRLCTSVRFRVYFPNQVKKFCHHAAHFALILVYQLFEAHLSFGSFLSSIQGVEPDQARILASGAFRFSVAVLAHSLPKLPCMPGVEFPAFQLQNVNEKHVAFFVSGFPLGIVFRLVFSLLPISTGLSRPIAVTALRIVCVLVLFAAWTSVNFAVLP